MLSLDSYRTLWIWENKPSNTNTSKRACFRRKGGSVCSVKHFHFQYLHGAARHSRITAISRECRLLLSLSLFSRIGQCKCEWICICHRRPNFAKLKWSPGRKSWPWSWLFLFILNKSVFGLYCFQLFLTDAWRYREKWSVMFIICCRITNSWGKFNAYSHIHIHTRTSPLTESTINTAHD